EVVKQLVAAGAIVIGKTNLDQFATGLVGVRSPYGVPRNPFNPDYIPGGSSSGSGRVPAGFNNIVGWKPTPGRVSTNGVVPACKSLDCVSVFTVSSVDADL